MIDFNLVSSPLRLNINNKNERNNETQVCPPWVDIDYSDKSLLF